MEAQDATHEPADSRRGALQAVQASAASHKQALQPAEQLAHTPTSSQRPLYLPQSETQLPCSRTRLALQAVQAPAALEVQVRQPAAQGEHLPASAQVPPGHVVMHWPPVGTMPPSQPVQASAAAEVQALQPLAQGVHVVSSLKVPLGQLRTAKGLPVVGKIDRGVMSGGALQLLGRHSTTLCTNAVHVGMACHACRNLA